MGCWGGRDGRPARATLAPALVLLLDLFGLGTPNADRIAGFVIVLSVALSFAIVYYTVKSVLSNRDQPKEDK